MDDKVKLILDDKEYELIYNDQTGYYEIDLVAPKTTGIHVLEFEFTSGQELATSSTDLIVLKKEEKHPHIKEVVAYFLDKRSFEIVDVAQLKIDEINTDLETNGNSIFTSIKKLNVEEDDFIYLKKEDKINFLGLVVSQEQIDNSYSYTLTCKDILSLFDIKMFVENEDKIKNVGIEDFIMDAIKKEFISNSDSFVNRNYLSVEALTHTPKNVKLDSVANVADETYNLLTFINNAIEKYDVQLDFYLTNSGINIKIFTKTSEVILIDATTSDISNYSEVFSLSYISKVEVKNKENGNVYCRYLLNDRTTTTNKNDTKRLFGKVEKVVVEKETEAEQKALDIFKGNSYNHNITFDINKDSKLHNIEKIKKGTLVLIKTKNNIIHNTYISKIKDSENKFLTVTCGNLRVDYIDKFLQERRKNK